LEKKQTEFINSSQFYNNIKETNEQEIKNIIPLINESISTPNIHQNKTFLTDNTKPKKINWTKIKPVEKEEKKLSDIKMLDSSPFSIINQNNKIKETPKFNTDLNSIQFISNKVITGLLTNNNPENNFVENAREVDPTTTNMQQSTCLLKVIFNSCPTATREPIRNHK